MYIRYKVLGITAISDRIFTIICASNFFFWGGEAPLEAVSIVLQHHWLRRYNHVFWKNENDCVKHEKTLHPNLTKYFKLKKINLWKNQCQKQCTEIMNNKKWKQKLLTEFVPADTADQHRVLEHQEQTSCSRPPSTGYCICHISAISEKTRR